MTDLDDEFRFFASDAALVGHFGPLPEVSRVWAEVSGGRSVAGIAIDPQRSPEYVFLHGMGLNAHGFDPVALALGAPTLALDLPGHGRSDWRADANYRPDLLAADVVNALDTLAPGTFTLVGHSLGGLTAALAAPALTERVHELVLIDITPGVRPQQDAGTISDFISGKQDFANLDEMVDRALQYGIGDDRAALTRGVALNSRQRADGRWEWTHHFAHMPESPAETFGEEHPFAALWAPLQQSLAAGVGVSQIRASAGMVTEALADEWRERLPGSEVLTVTGPHNLHETSPKELALALHQLQPSRK